MSFIEPSRKDKRDNHANRANVYLGILASSIVIVGAFFAFLQFIQPHTAISSKSAPLPTIVPSSTFAKTNIAYGYTDEKCLTFSIKQANNALSGNFNSPFSSTLTGTIDDSNQASFLALSDSAYMFKANFTQLTLLMSNRSSQVALLLYPINNGQQYQAQVINSQNYDAQNGCSYLPLI